MSASAAIAPAPLPAGPALDENATTPRAVAARIRAHGFVCFRVLGGSMFPCIRSGDLVFARRCELPHVSPGEVVVFERDGRLFVHRVLQCFGEANRREPRIITKGDALDSPDAPVHSSEFLGRVIRIHRNRRHIDLESLGHSVLGRFIAFLSPHSALLYHPLRQIKHAFCD